MILKKGSRQKDCTCHQLPSYTTSKTTGESENVRNPWPPLQTFTTRLNSSTITCSVTLKAKISTYL